MKADVVIIGGGLAGASAAIHLARAGREVVLIEREATAQHKVCGEFLSREALLYLHELGLDAASLKQLGAVTIDRVRLAGPRRTAQAVLPFCAMSLTRKRLDEELLRLASEAGAIVLRGTRVHSLERSGEGWVAAVADAHIIAAAAFLATGKHDLTARPRPAGVQRGLIGLKMYFMLTPEQTAELAGHVELVTYPGGYAGLQLVEDGAANLCCLIEQHSFHGWDDLFAAMQQASPHLAQRLCNATPLLAKPLAIAPIPYGYVRPAAPTQPCLWALGDQAAVIPSFTGDGMSIALHSGALAASMHLAGAAAESFQRRLHHELSRQVALATMLSRGLVWPPTRMAFTALAQTWPGMLRVVARNTRIANAAISAAMR